MKIVTGLLFSLKKLTLSFFQIQVKSVFFFSVALKASLKNTKIQSICHKLETNGYRYEAYTDLRFFTNLHLPYFHASRLSLRPSLGLRTMLGAQVLAGLLIVCTVSQYLFNMNPISRNQI